MHTWRTLPARYHSGRRPAPPTLVVVHCTEGSTAEGAARWFQNPRAAGSAHVVVDDFEVYRCVDDMDMAWHAKGHNAHGLGLEVAGFARWTEGEWLAHKPRLTEAARIHAGWCRKYGIPLVRSSRSGFHPHAGLPGNDHWDPGDGFPWAFYLGEVRRFLGYAEQEEGAPARPFGRSLRIIRGKSGEKRYARWGGWTEDEVPKGWDGPALGPLKALARIDGPVKVPMVLTWNGGRFDKPDDLPKVARTILNRYPG